MTRLIFAEVLLSSSTPGEAWFDGCVSSSEDVGVFFLFAFEGKTNGCGAPRAFVKGGRGKIAS
eukprot:2415956-Prorocentrum_lima.AAC.1